MLQGKNVVLAVTGSIAAYKSALIVRLLIKEGANIKVVMTKSAIDFITPLTLSTLAKTEVYSDFTSNKDKGTWNNHVDLGLWADYMLVAPATANTLSKMASGEADNFMMAVYLSAKCPVFIAPAMDLDMYKHQSTRDNIKKLVSFGNTIIYPESGELASGLEGEGRLAEPEHIIDFLNNHIKSSQALFGKKVLISAGPTHEALDPVRYLGNRSTGKMGYAIAEQAYELGADVTLISGPVALNNPKKGIKRICITSAQDLYSEMINHFDESDIVIMAAAVADYTPKIISDSKMKKKEGELVIELKRTQDILVGLGEKKKSQFMVGFALETNNELENAIKKRKKKSLDLIVLNSLNDKGAGFAHNTNKITIIGKDNNITKFELKSKQEVAKDILNQIIKEII
ncbi:MAG: phosphopantothenoylcysteine decarboxylase/phosphopantothenate--cysteine ligase [Urechidicola sp.]|jgi:phosphopantothenoylcysteine decarboxylase/phosphopantothenate--cysteine ligase|tara:strand:- start:2864 stop:4063 length:1200 start_codon:yes stop_codon:yes gene_type:complete